MNFMSKLVNNFFLLSINYFFLFSLMIRKQRISYPANAHDTGSFAPLCDLINSMFTITCHCDGVLDNSRVAVPI